MRSRILPIAAALVLALAGCSSGNTQAEDTSSKTEETQEATTEETTEDATDEGESIDWTEVKTAEEAAKGAGFDRFGVIDKFVIGDLEFANPTFAYAGGVAQATYETPATAVFLRKGVDTYSVPLSDRDLDEFAARWYKVYEGVEVKCYGPAKGAITVATWTDGSNSYGLTFQGLGGDEMSMDTDELHTIVKGVNEANADQKASEEKDEKKDEEKQEEKKPEEAPKTALLSQEDAEKKAENACGADCVSIDLVSTKQYGDCWYAVCQDSKGTKYEYYVNNDGVYLIAETPAKEEEQKPEEKKPENEEEKQPADEHTEGEPVTIYGTIYAQWHKMNDGTWYATFITYNNTQIFAQPAPAGGGWVFYAFANGTSTQVIYSDVESADVGEYGPAGVSSHWQALDGSAWF